MQSLEQQDPSRDAVAVAVKTFFDAATTNDEYRHLLCEETPKDEELTRNWRVLFGGVDKRSHGDNEETVDEDAVRMKWMEALLRARDAVLRTEVLHNISQLQPLELSFPIAGLETNMVLSPLQLVCLYIPLCWRIVQEVSCAPDPTKRVLVGVAGAGGSGKSTLAAVLHRLLCLLFLRDLSPPSHDSSHSCLASASPASTSTSTDSLSPPVAVIGMDGYHLRNEVLEERGLRPFKGTLQTFDMSRFADDLTVIASSPVALSGDGMRERNRERRREEDDKTDEEKSEQVGCGGFKFPAYDRNLHDPVEDALFVPSHTRLLLVEGLFVASDVRVRGLLSLSLLLTTSEDSTIQRLLDRKTKANGQPLSEAALEIAMAHIERVDLANHRYIYSTSKPPLLCLDTASSSLSLVLE